jgi:hypothetical protein
LHSRSESGEAGSTFQDDRRNPQAGAGAKQGHSEDAPRVFDGKRQGDGSSHGMTHQDGGGQFKGVQEINNVSRVFGNELPPNPL